MAGIIAWIIGHSALMAGFGVAFLDFLFGVNPNWSSNGILHWLYLFLKSKLGGSPAA